MTLAVVYPPGTVIPPDPPRRDGELHLVEAWPGSIVTVPEFEDEDGSVAPQLLGFVLDYAGELPPGRIGVLFVLRPNEVEAARAHNERPARREPRTYARREEGENAMQPSAGHGTAPPCTTTTCRMVEAWPGSVGINLGRNGHCPQIDGFVHTIEGALPEQLIGQVFMQHLTDCSVHRGEPYCDCFEQDEEGDPTDRRTR